MTNLSVSHKLFFVTQLSAGECYLLHFVRQLLPYLADYYPLIPDGHPFPAAAIPTDSMKGAQLHLWHHTGGYKRLQSPDAVK